MTKKSFNQPQEALVGAFGFIPDEVVSHFLVQIPLGTQQPVQISEHLSWNPEDIAVTVHFGERIDGQVRSRLDRPKWNAIADAVRAEFNARLRKDGKRPGRWKTGNNLVSRVLGKELTLLTWAIEDADPALIPIAIANWQGLAPEERWWLYTMTAAATGSYVSGRGRGWRKAVRFALTENPVPTYSPEHPIVPEFFRLLSETMTQEGEVPKGRHPAEARGNLRVSDDHDPGNPETNASEDQTDQSRSERGEL